MLFAEHPELPQILFFYTILVGWAIIFVHKITLIEKEKLSKTHSPYIADRLRDPTHSDDAGPAIVWNTYFLGMYAVIDIGLDLAIGLIEASGDKPAPGWWVDSRFRNQGYGKALVDVLAEHLVRTGIKQLGVIRVQGNSQEYSRRLVDRLLNQLSYHLEQATN